MRWRPSVHAGSYRSTLAIVVVSRALAALLQGLTYIIAARQTAASDFGVILAGMGVATVAIAVSDLGLTPLLMRSVGAGLLRPAEIVSFLSTRIISGFLVGGIWMGVFAFTDSRLVPVGAFIAAESTLQVLTAWMLAAGHPFVSATSTVLARMMSVIGTALATGAAWGLPVALSLGSLVGACCIFPCLRRIHRLGDGGLPRLRWRLVGRSRHFLGAGVLAQLANVDTSILAAVSGAAAATYYGVPSRLTVPLGLVATAYSNVILPRAAAAWGQRNAAVLTNMRSQLVRIALMISGGLGVLACLAGPVVPALLGHTYEPAVTPMRVVLVATAIALFNQPLAALIQAAGQDRWVFLTLLTATPIGLLAVAFGSFLADASGAGWGLVVMQVCVFAMLWPKLASLTRALD